MKKLFRAIFKGSSTDDKEPESKEQTIADTTAQKNERDNALRADTLKFDAIRAMKINEFDFAIEALLKSLELRPEFEARYYLADIYTKAGRSDKALEQMNQLLEEEPEHLPTLLNRAKLRLALNRQLEEALQDLNRALELASEEEEIATLYYVMAQCHDLLESNSDAMEAVNKSLEHPAEVHMLALLLRVKLHFEERRFQDAQCDIKKGRTEYPEEEQFLIWQGRLFAQKEDWQAASSCFNEVLDLNPFSEEAHLAIAKLTVQQGDTTKAEAYLRKSIEDLPHSFALSMLLVELLEAGGRNAEAEELKASLREIEAVESSQDFSQLYAGGLY